ncbi:MAG: type III secretion system inner membrane ring subunit SctD [Puniceicoccales bacterium]|jgi:type III secretion system YscD/HrpQ family protein|nr:type III secretion system inner membrane ring subunit SctD [Puniceicoccales bacterium]
MALLLKILSGPHQGAEVALPDESIVVGSDESCDLILNDALVVDKHVKITKADGSGFELEPMNGNVFMDGHLVEGKTAGGIFKFITLGTTQLMVGPEADEGWSKISLDSAPVLDHIEDKKEETTDSAVAKAKKEPTRGLHKKKLPLFWRFFIPLTAAAGVVFIGFKLTKKNQIEVAVDPVVEIKNKINSLNIPGTTNVNRLKDGSIYVTGYVSLIAQSTRIKAEVHTVDPNVKVKVYSGEKIGNTVNEILRGANLTVKFEETAPGKFVVSGYVFDPVVWDRMKHRLAEEVKGLENFVDNVLTQTKVLKLGNEVLKKYSLGEKLRFSCNRDCVTIDGVLTERDKNNWIVAKEEIEKTITIGSEIVFSVKMSTDTGIGVEKYFGGKIDSIVYNKDGLEWINMRDGRKYFEGSVLPSGYIISNIEKDSIIIKGPDGSITVNVEQM